MYLTHKQIVFRRRIKKFLIFFLFLFIGWISFGLYLTLNIKTTTLEKIGYSKVEINVIEDILSNKEVEILSQYDYQKRIKDILVNDNFKKEKLSDYINYYTQYETVTDDDLMYIVNNEYTSLEYNEFNKEIMYYDNFDIERAKRYKEYNDEYDLNLEDVIFAVNKNFDEYDIKYDKKYLKFLDKEYTIMSKLKRYDKYYKKHDDLDINTIIALVNSNVDKTDTKNTNTDRGILIIVNNYYTLDKDYIPDDLVDIKSELGKGKMNEEAYNNYKNMYEDALKDDIKLYINKSYVSYNEQSVLHNKNKTKYAKPGNSEFQTGLLIEIDNNEWLDNNAHQYGFIKRYPKDKKEITGLDNKNAYRYVGIDVATFIKEHNITYEEYYAYFVNQ